MDKNVQPPIEQNNDLEILRVIWNFIYEHPGVLLSGCIGGAALSIGIMIDKRIGGNHE